MFRNLFLAGTVLVLATNVWAFGGIGIGSLQHHKSKSGVDAIGVHIDNTGKKANINIVDGETEEEITCPKGVSKDRNGFCALCDNGNLYFPYRDEPCAKETNINKQHCETGSDCESGCCSDNGWCTLFDEMYSGECIDGSTCVNNDDCKTGEFCDRRRFLNENEEVVTYGVCTQIGGHETLAYHDRLFEVSDNSYLTFMGAMNWCHALGMEMATGDDLGVSKDLVCSSWSNACDPDILAPFRCSEKWCGYWFNDGMKISWGYESFHSFISSPNSLLIAYSLDCDEDATSHNRALCVVPECSKGYVQKGKCVKSCGEYEYIGENNLCVCKEGFVWGEETCGCPANYYLSGNTCVECPEDETTEEGNADSTCKKIVCNYSTAVSPVKFHYCCESDELDLYCSYWEDGSCECGH